MSEPAALTADDLDQLLAQCEAAEQAAEDLCSGELENWVEQVSNLRQQVRRILQPLAKRPIQPRSLEQLEALGRYLDHCDLQALHLQLLNACAPSLWSALAPDQQYQVRIDHGFSVARLSDDPHASLPALAQLIESVPAADQSVTAWDSLAELASAEQDYEFQRQCLHKQYAALSAQSQQHTACTRARAAADYHLKLAESYYTDDHNAKSLAHVKQALDALADPACQIPCTPYNNWFDLNEHIQDALELGERALEIQPDLDLFENLAKNLRASLPADISPAPRRALEVRLARLHAPLLYAEGQLNDAIATGYQGAFGLDEDNDEHPPICQQLTDWLEEVGRTDEMLDLLVARAQRADPGAQQHIEHLIAQGQHRRADLPLALVHACSFASDACDWLHPGETRHAFVQRMLALAREWEPDSPHADLLEGHYLCALNRRKKPETYARALPLLERGAREVPERVDYHQCVQLLTARLFVHGLEAGFNQPLLPIQAGLWASELGYQLDSNTSIARSVRQLGPWPQALAIRLRTQIYEVGLARFERFFATGQGHFHDANADKYTILCHNLGISLHNQAWELQADDPQRCVLLERALSLHRKGIAAAPSTENYQRASICLYDLPNRREEYLQAAEDLWQFSEENGYCRNQSGDDIYRVAWTLNHLNRHAETTRWLPRLQKWWDSRSPRYRDNPANIAPYLGALCQCLDNWSMDSPQDALARLQIDLPAIREHADAEAVLCAAQVMRRAGHNAEALALYDLSLQRHGPDDAYLLDFTQARRQDCLTDLEQAAAQARRPWWKFW